MTFKAILTVALKEKLNKESLLRGKDDMWRVKRSAFGKDDIYRDQEKG